MDSFLGPGQRKKWAIYGEKSRKRETLNMSTCVDSSPDTKQSPRGQKWTETKQNKQKHTETHRNAQNRTETDRNGQLRTDTDRNNQKQTESDRNGEKN